MPFLIFFDDEDEDEDEDEEDPPSASFVFVPRNVLPLSSTTFAGVTIAVGQERYDVAVINAVRGVR